MKRKALQLLLVLFFISLSYSQSPYLTYDPSDAAASATINLLKQNNRYAWFHQVTTSTPTQIYRLTVFDKAQVSKKKTVTYTPANTGTAVKSISPGLSCALFFDNTAVPKTMSAYKFQTSSATPTLQEEIIGSTLIADTDATKSFQIADLCAAIRIDANIYHYTVSVGYQIDTHPVWTDPVLTADFSYTVAADGVYKWDSVSKAYAKIHSTTFYLNKKLWKSSTKLVVLSWADSATPGQTNLKNYKVQAFSISGDILTQSALIQGKSYDPSSNVGPQISVSLTFQTIVVFGQATSSTIFVKGKTIDYTANTSVDLQIPDLITGTSSYITVSDAFVYARNKVNKIGTSNKYHGGYQIFGSKLAKYYESALQPAEITQWTKTLIYDISSKQLLIYRAHSTVAGVIRLQQQVYSLQGQVFRWDKTNMGVNTITGAGTSFSQALFIPAWFSESVISSGKKFTSAYLHPTLNTQLYVSLSTVSTSQLKVVSANKKCAAIYDSAGPSLKVYSFQKLATDTLTTAAGRLVSAGLYSGIDITTLTATNWQIADDCSALRIDSKIMHWDSSTTNYIVDTFPPGVALTNPIFSVHFSFIICDNAIYHWTMPTAGSAGSYSLDRTDTFNPNRKIWKYLNNIIIFTQKQTTVGSGKWDWRIQYNTVTNGTLTSFGQAIGQSTESPLISVSLKISKVVVYGKRFDDATKSFYDGKSIDYQNKIVKDIVFPTQITSVFNEIINTDDFLYARNKQGQLKHFGYIIMGSTLIAQFNEPVPLPLTVDYVRSVILPDVINGRMIVASQLNSNQWIRLAKTQKKSPGEIINPNQVSPYEMTFNYDTTGTLKRQISPKFRKWLFTTQTGTKLNYVQYDPSIADTKKKVFQKTPLSAGNNVIIDISQDIDCALTSVTGSFFDVIKINSSSNQMVIINAYSKILTDFNTAANISSAISQQKVKAGPGCWAFKLGSLIYVKNSTGDGFQKAPASATVGFNTAVYDISLKFSLAGNTVYKFNDVDYISKFTVEGLNTTRKIYSSADQNKILIISYDLLTVPVGTPAKMSGSAKLFANNGSVWNQMPLNFKIPNVLTTFDIVFSPNFQTIGFILNNLTASRLVKPSIKFFQVNYTANTFDIYQSNPQFEQISITQKFVIFDSYLYYLKRNIIDNTNNQFFYKFNPLNKKINEVGRNNVDPSFSQSLLGGQMRQQSGQLVAIFQMQQPGGVIVIMKRPIGGTGIQTQIKGIQTLQSGVVIVNNVLTLCPPGCSYCLNPTSCVSCLDGFVIDLNNFCIRCGGQCKTCTTTALDICVSCFNGFYLSSESCLRCNQTCLSCSSSGSTSCTACKVGYFIDSISATGSCSACIDNCVKCTKQVSDTDALCQTCRLGFVYHPTIKTCIKCISGCFNCKYEKIYQCEKCGDGFWPVFINGTLTQCKKCPKNCKVCTQNNCTNCRDGFRPLNGSCLEQCKLPCGQCSQTNSSKCTTCIGGFLLDGQTCKPDFACNTTTTCTSCPLGFNLIAGNCFKCNGGQNCRTCQNMNIQKCSSCIKGYYLTQTAICTACTAVGCGNCRDEFYCLKCLPGYTLSGTSQASQCIKCHQSCATCFEQPNNCDLCADGFTKRGWKCSTTSNVKFDLRLNADFDTMTTEQFIAIEQQVCTLIHKDKSQMNIQDLRTGSIVIGGTIDVANSTQQSNLVSSLAVAFGAGSSLGGFSIQTSSFISQDFSAIPTGSDDGDAVKKRNLAIILGIILPALFIILLIVLFVLYKKGIICNKSSSVQIQEEQRRNASDADLKNNIKEMDPMSLQS